MHRTIKYRLHPQTQEKAKRLYQVSGACRYVWNHFVSKLRDEYECYGKSDYRYFTIGKQFTLLRRYQVKWLQHYSANIVKASLKPIQETYQGFFRGQGGLPKFKGRHTSNPSFPLVANTFKLDGKYLHIAKIGYVRLVGNNPYPNSKAVSGTVKNECGKWYAYLCYKVDEKDMPAELPHTVREAGIDRNVGQIALSDGTIYRLPNTERLEARKRRYQRRYAREVKGSKRRGRVRLKLAKTHKKIAQARTNWCHQVSREIANKYDVVYLEDLKIQGMTASAKGTIENPGRNVSQKAGLNREILNTGWHKLEQCLDYKARVIKVPASYTSQKCSQCGHTEKQNRKTQADFECQSCGHRAYADINAALNILALGNSATGRGGGEVTRSMKRQIDTGVSVAYPSI